MKMKTPRIVPLSRQAIEILTELRGGFHEFLAHTPEKSAGMPGINLRKLS
jgi:hypothetical protein